MWLDLIPSQFTENRLWQLAATISAAVSFLFFFTEVASFVV